MALQLYLVRHGESVANQAGELVGRRDPALSAAGRVHAERVAADLARRVDGVPVVVTSPLQRAAQTADAIAEAVGTTATEDSELTELDFGILDGTQFQALLPSWPPDWVRDTSVPCPGGESYDTLTERIVRRLAHWCTAAPVSGTVVAVTHLGPVKVALRHALGADGRVMDRVHISPGGVVHLTCAGGTFQFVSLWTP